MAELKGFMYEAKTLSGFKNKLQSYELLQSKLLFSDSRERKSKTTRCKEDGKRGACFTCRDRDHYSFDCPKRGKGPRCFGCDQIGHIKPNCPNNKSIEARGINCLSEQRTKTKKRVDEALKNLQNEIPVKRVGGLTSLTDGFAAAIEIDGGLPYR